MKQGYFIACDGPDGAGKSTQVRRLATSLRAHGYSVCETVDPGGTALGKRVRELLLFTESVTINMRAEALLFLAARAQLVSEVVKPALNRGEVVISDRFAMANIVYQGHAGQLNVELIKQMTEFATDRLEPDLTLIFDVSTDVAKSRRKPTPDRLEARGDDYHARVRQGFLSEATKQPERIIIVSAESSVDIVAQDTLAIALRRLKEFDR